MIALCTDFGTRDAYVAQMKGAIFSINPAVTVLDLNHDIGQFDIRQAAYLLAASCRYFPAHTIFVVVVDPGVGTARRPLLVHTQADKYYVGPDNGVLTLVLEHEGWHHAYVLQQVGYFRDRISSTFHGRDIFAPVAAHLANGVAATAFGPEVEEVVRLPYHKAQRQGQVITGEIIHIDHFGNVITNIPAAFLSTLTPGHMLTVAVQEHTHRVPLLTTYGTAPAGQLFGLINSSDAFELALPQHNAAAALHVHPGELVTLTL